MNIHVINSQQCNNTIISTNCGIMTDNDKHDVQLFLNKECSNWWDILTNGVILEITSFDEIQQRTIIHGIIRVANNPIDYAKYGIDATNIPQKMCHEITHVLIDESLIKQEEFEHYYKILFNYIIFSVDSTIEHIFWFDYKHELSAKVIEIPYITCEEYRYKAEAQYFANKTIISIERQADMEARILKK